MPFTELPQTILKTILKNASNHDCCRLIVTREEQVLTVLQKIIKNFCFYQDPSVK